MFVKPARLGSSVGISRAGTSEEFAKAVAEAFRHDRKILVEEYVRGREIECAVLEDADGSLTVSSPGEIVPSNRHSFYSYEAKYLDDQGAKIKVPADLPPEVGDKLRKLALEAFRALGCEGLARVDFFLREDGKATGQRGEHHAGLHQYQHVSEGDGGERRRLSRPHRSPHPPRARPRRVKPAG